MNTSRLIAYARSQLSKEHTKPTWENIAKFLAAILVGYIAGTRKLSDQALAEISKTPAPVVGHKETDVDT